MKPRTVLAIAFTLAFVAAPGGTQPPSEGAFGLTAEIPPIVAMTGEQGDYCPGKEVARGVLSIADHENSEGYFNFVNPSGGAGVSVPPGGLGMTVANQYKGERVLLVVRPERCEPQKLERGK